MTGCHCFGIHHPLVSVRACDWLSLFWNTQPCDELSFDEGLSRQCFRIPPPVGLIMCV